VLLVGADGRSRLGLEGACTEALARAQTDAVADLSDAVLRLARGGVAVVVLHLPSLGRLNEAAPVLLRGLAPQARFVAVGGACDWPGVELVPDAAGLAVWLRAADRSGAPA
jgi:hypothetical protein